MMSRPSNLTTETHARPEARIWLAIDRASRKRGGGSMHGIAAGDPFATRTTKWKKFFFQQLCQLD
jgi:hypothetical protein